MWKPAKFKPTASVSQSQTGHLYYQIYKNPKGDCLSLMVGLNPTISLASSATGGGRMESEYHGNGYGMVQESDQDRTLYSVTAQAFLLY